MLIAWHRQVVAEYPRRRIPDQMRLGFRVKRKIKHLLAVHYPKGIVMKILHVVQGYPPAIGGTEEAFGHLSEQLVRQFGDEVSVFTTNCYGGDAFNRFGLAVDEGWTTEASTT